MTKYGIKLNYLDRNLFVQELTTRLQEQDQADRNAMGKEKRREGKSGCCRDGKRNRREQQQVTSFQYKSVSRK